MRTASLDTSRSAGGPAGVANRMFAVAPWLCVSAFRRICSEQQSLCPPVTGIVDHHTWNTAPQIGLSLTIGGMATSYSGNQGLADAN